MNRRSAIFTALAGPALLARALDSKALSGATLQEDEDGYQISLRPEPAKAILPLGNPAPAWLRNAEVYSGWYAPFSDQALETEFKDFPLIIGLPHQRSSADHLHRAGIRTVPYVSFYKALDLEVAHKLGAAKGVGDINELPSPFWPELDLGKHPDWKLYDKEGKVRQPFDDPKYPPAWSEVCTAAPGFAQAALRGVQGLLKLGFDGLFIDNVHPTPHCYGPELGKHTHVQGWDNLEAFRNLLSSVYALVKRWSSDNIVALNPGHVDPTYWPSADAIMYESYICTNPGNPPYTCSKGWDAILEKAQDCRRAVRDGKVVLALSYFGPNLFYTMNHMFGETLPPSPPRSEDVFYAYACARLSGFLWSDYFTLPPNDPAQALYKVRLGQVAGGMEEVDGVYFRRFERGIVVVNPLHETKQARIPLRGMPKLTDVCHGNVLEVSGDDLLADIPGQSGRVYCSLAI